MYVCIFRIIAAFVIFFLTFTLTASRNLRTLLGLSRLGTLLVARLLPASLSAVFSVKTTVYFGCSAPVLYPTERDLPSFLLAPHRRHMPRIEQSIAYVPEHIDSWAPHYPDIPIRSRSERKMIVPKNWHLISLARNLTNPIL